MAARCGAWPVEFGIVFQDTAIRRMVFARRMTWVPVSAHIGRSRHSHAVFDPRRRILSHSSFRKMVYKTDLSGQRSDWRERVDHTLLMDADMSEAIDMVACADPSSKCCLGLSLERANKGTDYLDKLLIYDWALDRWSQAEMQVQILAPIVPPAPTVSLDALGGIDALVASFDSYVSTPAPSFAAMASDRSIGFHRRYAGSVDTPEGSYWRRGKNFRPVSHAD